MIRKLSCLIAMVLVLSFFRVPSSALTVEQLRELLRDNYLEEVPESILSLPTVSEMLTALGDPYTRHLSAEEYATMMSWFEDTETTSLGVTLVQHDLGWMITKVYEDSGAEAAGIHPGEIITQVNGVSVAGKEPGEAAALLEGDAGTLLPVALLDVSGAARQVTATLRPFVILTTEFYDNGWLTGIYCAAFGEDTTTSFDEGLRKYNEKTDVWMLDMRANNGGSINAAVETANLLVGHPGETLASFQWRDGEIDALSGGRERLTTKPIVTVVSQNTISSGEIFVGILRDLDVGITVGMRTHGKGIAQVFLSEPTFRTLLKK